MSVKSYISSWLKRKLQPKKRCMYACLHGAYIGKMFLYIGEELDKYNFLILPDMVNIQMTFDTFVTGLQNHVIDKVQIIDKKYWEVCKEKFEKNRIEKTTK